MAEVCTSLDSNPVTKVVKSVFRSIKQEISYVFKYQSYMEDLKSEVQQLRHQRETEQLRVERAKRQGDKIHMDVDEWLIQGNEFMLNEFIKQVADPTSIGDEDQVKTHCFNLKHGTRLGRKQ